MAEQGKPSDLVTLQELALSNTYEIAALVPSWSAKAFSRTPKSSTRSPDRRSSKLVAADTPEPLEGFESWLLHHVPQAVEAGEGSGIRCDFH
jgi:hypothetical protein